MADTFARTQFWIHPDTRIGVHVQNAEERGGIPSLRFGGQGYDTVIDLPVYGYDKAETLATLRRIRDAVDLLVGMVQHEVNVEQDIDPLPNRWAPFPPLGIEDDVAGEAVAS